MESTTEKPKRQYNAHPNNRASQCRQSLHLTLRDVAAATGLSNTFIWQVEQGSDISVTNARKLAACYGTTIDVIWPKQT